MIRFQLPRDSFEYAVTIAASLTNYYLARDISVGLTTVGREFVSIPPEKGNRQLNKILEQLSIINDDGDLPIASIFEKQKANIPRGSSVVIITAVRIDEIESPIYTAKLETNQAASDSSECIFI